MYLSRKKLEAAFKKYGLDYRFEPGFASRGHGPMLGVKGTCSHYTAGAATGNYPSLRVVREGRPGLKGPLCNVGLARDGTVIGVAAGHASHAGKGSAFGLVAGNSWLIGIEAESTGKPSDWTPSQITAYPRLLAALREAYPHEAQWQLGHLEWAKPTGRKVDPGNWPGGMPALRATASRVYDAAHRPAKGPVTPTPRAVPKPSRGGVVRARVTRKLVVDGKFGPSTVKALQRALHVTVDGDYGKRTKVALQRHLHVTADGVVGPKTVKALQHRLHVTADGSWGTKTTAALQRRLNAGTF